MDKPDFVAQKSATCRWAAIGGFPPGRAADRLRGADSAAVETGILIQRA